MKMPAIVTVAALVLLLPLPLLSQQQPMSISLTAGSALPMGPEFFSSQWQNGYSIGAELCYGLTERLGLGGSFGYAHFIRTPDCVFGADREFVSINGVARYSFIHFAPPLHISLAAGFTYDYMGQVIRQKSGYQYANAPMTSFTPMIAGLAGVELPVTTQVHLAAETGLTMVFGTFDNSAFALIRVGAGWRL